VGWGGGGQGCERDLQVLDSVLEDGLDRVVVVDDEVGNVPVHKELAGAAAHNLIGWHTRIRAPYDESRW